MQQLPNTQGKKLVRMSSVDDAKLFDQDGHDIGGTEDVVMDAKSGKSPTRSSRLMTALSTRAQADDGAVETGPRESERDRWLCSPREQGQTRERDLLRA
jgi:hypothetical protein